MNWVINVLYALAALALFLALAWLLLAPFGRARRRRV